MYRTEGYMVRKALEFVLTVELACGAE